MRLVSAVVVIAWMMSWSPLLPGDDTLLDPDLPTPVLGQAAGIVQISCAMPEALLLYTIDGSDPVIRSGPYLAPIALAHGGTVKVRAFSPDRRQMSEVAALAVVPTAHAPAPPSSLVPVTQGREWPGYEWAKRHAGVCANVRARQPQIVFIGDSITHFFGGEPHDRKLNGEPTWQQFYASRNAVNLGFGWDRTENVLWRLGPGGELDGATPKVAVVMIGTNNLGLNAPADIAAGITAICALIHQQLPATRILLLGIFPRGEKPDANRQRIAEINQLVAKLDGRDGVTFLDFGARFLNPDGTIARSIMPDFLHPSQAGYQIWADAMEPTLARLLME
jgi:lysophospholipase L1-like esterase